MAKVNVAIDGLAASGKSTVARQLAERSGLIYLDTGLMYRALALQLSDAPPAEDFPAAVEEALASLALEIYPPQRPGDDCRMVVRGEDVTAKLHRPEVSRLVSKVAAISPVRRAMVAQQQEFAAAGGVIMVGRDIASVVLPQAELKIFLIADLDERARRRHLDFIEKGSSIPLERVREELAERDDIDTNRADSPLLCVEGARTLDTTGKTPEEVLATLHKWILEAEGVPVPKAR
jgi:cytidylate kinase